MEPENQVVTVNSVNQVITVNPAKVSKNYAQKFRDEWLADPRFRLWLRKVDGNDRNCFCRCCEVILTTKRSSIEKHGNTIKHKKAEELLTPEPGFTLPIIIKTETKSRTVHDGIPQYFPNNPEYEEGDMPDMSGHVGEGIEYAPDGSYIEAIKESPVKMSAYKRRKKNEAAAKKLPKLSNLNIVKGDSELDIFGKSIVAQMKMLPEKYAIGLTFDIQNLVTEKRLKALEEKNAAKQSGMENTQVITVSLGNNSYQTVQSSPSIYTSYQ